MTRLRAIIPLLLAAGALACDEIVTQPPYVQQVWAVDGGV